MANTYEIESEAEKKALENFASGFNCCQSVIDALLEYSFKIDTNESADLKKVATVFGGGIAGQKLECGALLAAAMAIGLKRGTTSPTEPRATTYDLVKELYRMFKGEYGHVICRDLCPCDLSTKEGVKEAHKNVCPKYVSTSVKLFFSLMKKDNNYSK